MLKFDKPDVLNANQLRSELEANGVLLPKTNSDLFDDGSGGLWLEIDDKDEMKAKSIIENHIAKPLPEPSIAEKLASVGLNLNDLKTALGL
jgi:hypothetical protein